MRILALSLSLLLTATLPTHAAGDEDTGLSIELNTLQASDKGCRLTFVAANHFAADVDQASFEVVLFDGKGLVDRMTVLNFKALPAGHARVRQFDIPQVDCGNVSRLLINAARSCEGAGLDAQACTAGLQTTSKSDVALVH